MGNCWLLFKAGSLVEMLCWRQELRFVRGLGKVDNGV